MLLIILRVVFYFVAISVVSVGFFYVMCFYEMSRSGHVLPLPRRTLSFATLSRAIGAFAREWLAAILTVVLRPLAWGSRSGRVGPKTAGVNARPVICIHGYLMNRSCFAVLAGRLKRTGRPVYTLNVPSTAPLTKQSSKLTYFVEEVIRETGASRVDLIGYSWGGIVARHYVERLSGKPRVGRVITIASPHRGSQIANVALTRYAAEMLPGSEVLADLQAAGLSSEIEYTSVYSPFDAFVLPPYNARLPEPGRNVEVPDTGHAGVLFSRGVAEAVLEALGLAEKKKVEEEKREWDRSSISASS